MTGIEAVRGSRVARADPRTATRTSAAFAVPESGAAPSNGVTEAAPAAALASMLALQEAGGEAREDREARRHGHDLLDALAALQRAVLTGCDDAAALERLADLAATVPLAADTRLAAMVSAIVVRAKVELARRRL
jgi:protein-disulfide isomerase-like protein with CxxC motif